MSKVFIFISDTMLAFSLKIMNQMLYMTFECNVYVLKEIYELFCFSLENFCIKNLIHMPKMVCFHPWRNFGIYEFWLLSLYLKSNFILKFFASNFRQFPLKKTNKPSVSFKKGAQSPNKSTDFETDKMFSPSYDEWLFQKYKHINKVQSNIFLKR